MRIGDWSSDVCSSDLRPGPRRPDVGPSMSEPIAPGPSAAPANGAPAVRWWWLLVGPLLALLLVAGCAAALIASGGDGDASDAPAMGSAPPPTNAERREGKEWVSRCSTRCLAPP